eukprot:2746081-Amphidinium_carterae.1
MTQRMKRGWRLGLLLVFHCCQVLDPSRLTIPRNHPTRAFVQCGSTAQALCDWDPKIVSPPQSSKTTRTEI